MWGHQHDEGQVSCRGMTKKKSALVKIALRAALAMAFTFLCFILNKKVETKKKWLNHFSSLSEGWIKVR